MVELATERDVTLLGAVWRRVERGERGDPHAGRLRQQSGMPQPDGAEPADAHPQPLHPAVTRNRSTPPSPADAGTDTGPPQSDAGTDIGPPPAPG